MKLLKPILIAVDADPAAHVGNHGGEGGENAVHGQAAHVGITDGGDQAGTTPLGNAEDPDATRVGVRPAFQKGQGCLGEDLVLVE